MKPNTAQQLATLVDAAGFTLQDGYICINNQPLEKADKYLDKSPSWLIHHYTELAETLHYPLIDTLNLH